MVSRLEATTPVTLHEDAIVVDAHNDLIALVDHFDRRGDRDHFRRFWLSELRAGGVDVQVLPICLEPEFRVDGALRRTLLLIERIHELAAEHAADVAVCWDGAELDRAIEARRIAFVIALEGSHAIGEDPALVGALARLGVRIASLAHFGRTPFADGSDLDDSAGGGLTPLGVEVLAAMEEHGILLDVSHLGRRGVDDLLSRARRPVLATHSACRALVDAHRNLDDDQIRRIAETGGVVGIAAAVPFFIDPEHPTVERVADHIEHVAGLVGFDHVGLGPDFVDDYFQETRGGWPPIPGIPGEVPRAEVRRPSDLPRVTLELQRRGIPEDDIRKVLGGNLLRVLRTMGAGAAR